MGDAVKMALAIPAIKLDEPGYLHIIKSSPKQLGKLEYLGQRQSSCSKLPSFHFSGDVSNCFSAQHLIKYRLLLGAATDLGNQKCRG